MFLPFSSEPLSASIAFLASASLSISTKPKPLERPDRRSVTTVAEILADRGVKLYIHPSHNIPGDTTSRERLDAALAEYKRRIAGV